MPFKMPLLLGKRQMCSDVTTLPVIHMLVILRGLEPSVDGVFEKYLKSFCIFILGGSCKIACITIKGKYVASEKPLFLLLPLKGACCF